jgi:hypothetical protein
MGATTSWCAVLPTSQEGLAAAVSVFELRYFAERFYGCLASCQRTMDALSQAKRSAVALVNHCLPDPGTVGALGDAMARGQNAVRTRILSCSSISFALQPCSAASCWWMSFEQPRTASTVTVHGNAQHLQWISSKRSQKCDGCGKMTTRHEISAKFAWNTSSLELAHLGCLTTFHPSL